MDSQHRHELQQSDLVEFIAHFGEWWSKHGIKTLLLLLVVVGAVFLYRMHRTRVERAHDAAWYDLASATSGDQYRGVARAHDVAAIHVLARLRAGDWALRKALAPDDGLGGDERGAASQPADDLDQRRQSLLADAEHDYQAVIDYPAAHPTLVLNALLGLAAVAESRAQWDKAREIYAQIQEQASSGQERLAQIAARHAAVLELAAKPVIFAPESTPEPLVGTEAGPQLPAIDTGPEAVAPPAASQPDAAAAP